MLSNPKIKQIVARQKVKIISFAFITKTAFGIFSINGITDILSITSQDVDATYTTKTKILRPDVRTFPVGVQYLLYSD